MIACNTTTGELIDTRYGDPMPWIGLYIAAGSLLCMLAMTIDTILGFRQRKFWFPCKFFTLNAAWLSILAIATKIPVDINNPMPKPQEQLMKLTGMIMISTAMGNFLPSLGVMRNEEILANILALGIMVVTMIVNVAIQMHTNVIYAFRFEHVVAISSAVCLLVILGSSAVVIPTTKELIDIQYESKHDSICETLQIHNRHVSLKEVREEIKKYWMMAHTSSPQFIMGRSATCTASGAICLINAIILIEAIIRTYSDHLSHNFCRGESEYKWSSFPIFFSQCITIFVGTIAPAGRWFSAISFRETKHRGNWNPKKKISVEKYWTQRLLQWKTVSMPFNLKNRNWRKIIYRLRNSILDFGILVQKFVVILSKAIRLISVLPVKVTNKILSLLYTTNSLCFLIKKNNQGGLLVLRREVEESVSHLDSDGGIYFVLHLDGEEGLVNFIEKRGNENMKIWIEVRKKELSKDLVKFPKPSSDLKGVKEFDNSDLRISHDQQPENCWSLTVATLTSIAVAISYRNVQQDRIKQLRRGVKQGLDYMKLIEKHLDGRGLLKMRQTANQVWVGLDIHDKWMEVDLFELANKLEPNKKTHSKILQILVEKSKEKVKNYLEGGPTGGPNEWPSEILASDSMYRITKTIQHKDQLAKFTDETLFTWLEGTISDIMWACLINLPRAAWMECVCSPTEKRVERVRNAVSLLAVAEVLNILDPGDNAGLVRVGAPGPKVIQYIDEWRNPSGSHVGNQR